MQKYKHSKTTCPIPYHMQKHYATKASPQVRIKKRKNCPILVPRYATIARHLNVVKIICALHFWREKSEMRFWCWSSA